MAAWAAGPALIPTSPLTSESNHEGGSKASSGQDAAKAKPGEGAAHHQQGGKKARAKTVSASGEESGADADERPRGAKAAGKLQQGDGTPTKHTPLSGTTSGGGGAPCVQHLGRGSSRERDLMGASQLQRVAAILPTRVHLDRVRAIQGGDASSLPPHFEER
eukprot:1150607-Pelagomonas_calceolata.AAC.3